MCPYGVDPVWYPKRDSLGDSEELHTLHPYCAVFSKIPILMSPVGSPHKLVIGTFQVLHGREMSKQKYM